MNALWVRFKTWFVTLFDYNQDGIVTMSDARDKVEDTKKETKRRVKRVKEEVQDVLDSAKDTASQAGDIVDAVKGKPRKGRKPKAKKAPTKK